MEYNKTLIKLNLSFFDDEKTESPTDKKRKDARDEGQVAKSPEILSAVSFIVMFYSIGIFGEYIFNSVRNIFMLNLDYFANYDNYFERIFTFDYLSFIAMKAFLTMLPLFAVAMLLGVILNLVQVGWHVTGKPLKPKFSKINPISGFKRLFSLRPVVELLKSLLKFGIILLIVYSTIKDELYYLPIVLNLTLIDSCLYFFNLAIKLGISVGFAFLFIAGIDYAYVRLKHEKDLKMSKQDIKDEYKQAEGDPYVKQRIKQRMREASMRRMMQDLPEADVIITNPTHFAVALRYKKEEGAPIVIAKGADFLAKRIREKAKEYDITIVENKPLARTLYSTVDIGKEIPPELYKSVAEVLAYVYKLKNRV